MKKRIFLETALICILGCTGWYLFNAMKRTESNSPVLKEIANNNNLSFSGGAGMDIMGNNVHSAFANTTDETERKVVAFLLRHNSLDADLRFWNEVNSHLSGLDSIRLTAYCENDRCTETIRKSPDAAHFTVLEYGGVIDMQAVIGADTAGEFWLRGNGARRIKWRNETLTPFDIAMKIGLGQ